MIVFLSVSAVQSMQAQEFESGEIFVNEEGIAIQGYDPVEYHLTLRAVRGDSSIRFQFQGATFYFRNVVNKKLFADSPQKYIPAYGGFCSDALSIPLKENQPKPGRYASDPEHFIIYDDRLFLFCPDDERDARTHWQSSGEVYIRRADSVWSVLLNS